MTGLASVEMGESRTLDSQYFWGYQRLPALIFQKVVYVFVFL